MSTDTKIKTLIFNKLTQEQYNNADRVPTEFYLTPDTSIDSSEKGAANGVASLDVNAKIPAAQIPVDGTTITVTEDGTISSVSGSGFDFEGTKSEFDAAVDAGTITDDSVSLITDDVSGDNVATKSELQAVDISKADTSLSNVLANIDYVVESKFPTADDPTWYRVYKSGWVEQGGVAGGSSAFTTVNLLKSMANTDYFVIAMSKDISSSVFSSCAISNEQGALLTTSSFKIIQAYNGDTRIMKFNWMVSGQGAQ